MNPCASPFHPMSNPNTVPSAPQPQGGSTVPPQYTFGPECGTNGAPNNNRDAALGSGTDVHSSSTLNPNAADFRSLFGMAGSTAGPNNYNSPNAYAVGNSASSNIPSSWMPSQNPTGWGNAAPGNTSTGGQRTYSGPASGSQPWNANQQQNHYGGFQQSHGGPSYHRPQQHHNTHVQPHQHYHNSTGQMQQQRYNAHGQPQQQQQQQYHSNHGPAQQRYHNAQGQQHHQRHQNFQGHFSHQPQHATTQPQACPEDEEEEDITEEEQKWLDEQLTTVKGGTGSKGPASKSADAERPGHDAEIEDDDNMNDEEYEWFMQQVEAAEEQQLVMEMFANKA